MQQNANMLKVLKKVRFCRFYWFLCKNAAPSLSPPRTNFCPSAKLCNALYITCSQGYKWALKNILHREIIRPKNYFTSLLFELVHHKLLISCFPSTKITKDKRP